MTSPEQRRKAWDRFAAGYDQAITPFSMQIAEDALERLAIEPGMRFLDVAAGGGALSIPAARRGAEVLATDFSPVMIERLRERAREEGLANLEARVMDGQDLELDDDSFDVSGSQFGIMMFPDRQSGLEELARVTKPGGRALMVVFGPVQAVEGFAYLFRALQATVPTFTPPTDSPLFSLQDRDQLRREMTAAGLRDVRVDTVNHGMEVESATQHWELMTSAAPAIGALAASLPEKKEAAAQDSLERILQERPEGTPTTLNMQFHIGIGHK
ncbi:MAG: methyltransferase domain-containing protein [Candidatus Promineifilaceae bacterium]|nr:methyltransferase domain-containing protein [Candidatus Promineifilaceae bacterium]